MMKLIGDAYKTSESHNNFILLCKLNYKFIENIFFKCIKK